MEGTIGEIRMFAGPFAPRNWAFCANQIVAIQSNMALFAVLGVTYGGNGSSTFALPDLRNRVVVGAGAATSGTAYDLGEMGGETQHTLINIEMPAHNHFAQVTASATSTATVTLNASSGLNSASPAGAVLGQNPDISTYAAGTSTPVAMAANAIQNVNVTTNQGPPTVTIQPAGGSQPHNNMQPYLGMNFVICMMGVYPSRN